MMWTSYNSVELSGDTSKIQLRGRFGGKEISSMPVNGLWRGTGFGLKLFLEGEEIRMLLTDSLGNIRLVCGGNEIRLGDVVKFKAENYGIHLVANVDYGGVAYPIGSANVAFTTERVTVHTGATKSPQLPLAARLVSTALGRSGRPETTTVDCIVLRERDLLAVVRSLVENVVDFIARMEEKGYPFVRDNRLEVAVVVGDM